VNVVVIAAMIEGVTLSDGTSLPADAQLEGAPSVLFDEVAVIAGKEGCRELMKKGAAIEFLQHAFGHLKAIGLNAAARRLADKAGLGADDFVIDLDEVVAPLVERAAQRLWTREAQVRPPL
jgi:catalase